MLIGAQKSGTTALAYYLDRHPRVMMAPIEVHYFDQHYDRGLSWYRAFFPFRARAVGIAVGEKSPNYIISPNAPARAHLLDPGLRILIALRDPVDRAYSHYHHEKAANREPATSFEEAIALEPERTANEQTKMIADPTYYSSEWRDHTYVARGEYIRFIDQWLECFAEDQILIVDSNELRETPQKVLREVSAFLGVPTVDFEEWPAIHVREPYAPMERLTRDRLAQHFAPFNARLYEFIGRDLGWSRPSAKS